MTITSLHALCECGCGLPAPVASKTDRAQGWVKGRPKRYIHGHRAKLQSFAFDSRWSLDPSTGCHVWNGVKNAKGYGRFGDRLAHRVAYERDRGPIPADLQVDHLCRNHSCVNSDHLELVTPSVNTQRGRRAKVTVQQVREIRSAESPLAEIAREHGLSVGHVASIRARRYWRDV